MPAVWRAIPATELEIRRWGSQTVIFHPGTGDTHLFDELGWKLLQLLQEKTMDTLALIEAFSAQPEASTETDISWQIREILEDMERLALITNITEPVSRENR